MKIISIILIILGALGIIKMFIREWRLGPWKQRKSFWEKFDKISIVLGGLSLILIWLGLVLGAQAKLFHF